ncbi:conserved hypothetical protein [Yersinia pestis biovar Antiqua str. UG05-0454]|uniref:Uncharacterized protein n=1 Tax=Yersinia pestis bv. Antiqua (strain Antiqua) TaxID=360102 RepID=A0A0H2Y588_YERPA|nr:conserved hypothetical protein [Yersinia pestis Antiqua]EDR61529.1 conserved hypothetical protein [Yersinia pestis biovar Antiqua str. UG05-0454]
MWVTDNPDGINKLPQVICWLITGGYFLYKKITGCIDT